MEKTLYTAVIEANDGIHLIRKNISDPTGEYEDFEFAMQNKANDLDGELHVIYAPEDVVEDITLDDDPAPRLWYAVQTNREDDWGTGSYSLEEAKTMARKQRNAYPDTLIAVIDNTTNPNDPFCLEEITDF